MGNSERDRLQRIREQQIKARDPGKSKIPGYDWQQHAARGRAINASRRKKAERPWVVRTYELLPGRLKGAVIGLWVGAFPAIAGLILLSGEWKMLAIIPPMVFAVLGYLIGMMMEPDRDLYM